MRYAPRQQVELNLRPGHVLVPPNQVHHTLPGEAQLPLGRNTFKVDAQYFHNFPRYPR
jgi:hypothetical protein